MARHRDRSTETPEPVRGFVEERRRVAAAGFLFAVVIVVLVLGAALRTEPSRPSERWTPSPVGETGEARPPAPPPAVDDAHAGVPPAAVETAPQAPPQDRTAAIAPPPAEDPLETRLEDDRERLVRTNALYTVQLMVACDPDNARRVVDLAGAAPELYVLGLRHEGQPCYRLCWGAYGSHEAAERGSRSLPRALAARFPEPQVRGLDEVAR